VTSGAHVQSNLMTICQTTRLNAVDPLDWLSQLLRSPETTPHLVPEPPPWNQGAQQLLDAYFDVGI